MYIDMHCHCNEYSLDELKKYINSGIHLVGVSEDPESINVILEYWKKLRSGFTPCIGLHPWIIHKYSVDDARRIVEIALEKGVKCLGEIGLDKRFVPKTYDHQLEVFKVFVEAAKEYGFVLNLHTPGAWREVYEILVRNDISKAYFHWYTGPLDLLVEFEAMGYFIGINPAWRIQEKHRRIIEEAPLNVMITESDAPYKYKGLELNPLMIPDTVKYIASIKSINEDIVREKILANAKKLLGFS